MQILFLGWRWFDYRRWGRTLRLHNRRAAETGIAACSMILTLTLDEQPARWPRLLKDAT